MAALSEPLTSDPKGLPSKMNEGGRPKKGYLPSLDGWRAIAILSVIQFHDRLYQFGWLSNGWIHDYGATGVDLFFAISGYLICSRLLSEDEKQGFISLRGFYIRRCFRIMPAAWLYLAVYASLSLANLLPRDWGGLLTSLLMVRNFWVWHVGDQPSLWYTIHFWSLSVEEHFYLLLPGLLVLVARRKRLMATAILALLSTIWALCIVRFGYMPTPGVPLRTDYRLCELMVPAFLAILLARERAREFVIRWLSPWVAFSLFASLLLVGTYIKTISPLAVIIGFPLIVIATVHHPLSWTTSVLELPFLRFIGRISYSLYLWQQLFFLLGHQRASWPVSVLQYAPWNYLAAFTCAISSYYLIERPMIRLGHKFASH